MDLRRFDQITRALTILVGRRRLAALGGLLALPAALAPAPAVVAAPGDKRRRPARAAGKKKTCKAGKERCGGTCVNVRRSTRHCGKCGNRCLDQLICARGKCAGKRTATWTKVDDVPFVAPVGLELYLSRLWVIDASVPPVVYDLAAGTGAANGIHDSGGTLTTPVDLVFFNDTAPFPSVEYLWVTDSATHEVKELDVATGDFVPVLGDGTPGSGPNQMNAPGGITITSDPVDGLVLVVVDTNNQRLLGWILPPAPNSEADFVTPLAGMLGEALPERVAFGFRRRIFITAHDPVADESFVLVLRPDGSKLAQWGGANSTIPGLAFGRITGIANSGGGSVYILEGRDDGPGRISVLSPHGKLRARFSLPLLDGNPTTPTAITSSPSGTLFVSDKTDVAGRILRFGRLNS